MTTVKLILGGVVAVVSSFGITITVAVLFLLAVAETHNQKAAGFSAYRLTAILHSGWLWLAVFVIFSTGLFLTYRKLYL